MFTSEDEHRLIRYLLDDVSDEDREAIEAQYLLDDEWFAQLQALETQLIRDYLKKDLAAEQLRRFEDKYLAVPDLRRKVHLASAMTEAAHPQIAAARQSAARAAEVSKEQFFLPSDAGAPGLKIHLASAITEAAEPQIAVTRQSVSGGAEAPPEPFFIRAVGGALERQGWVPWFAMGVALAAGLVFLFGPWFNSSQPDLDQQAQRTPGLNTERRTPAPVNPPDPAEGKRVALKPQRKPRSGEDKPLQSLPSPEPRIYALVLDGRTRSYRGGASGGATLQKPPEGSVVELDIDVSQLGDAAMGPLVVSVRSVDREAVIARQKYEGPKGRLSLKIPVQKLPVDDYLTTITSLSGDTLFSYSWKMIPAANPPRP